MLLVRCRCNALKFCESSNPFRIQNKTWFQNQNSNRMLYKFKNHPIHPGRTPFLSPSNLFLPRGPISLLLGFFPQRRPSPRPPFTFLFPCHRSTVHGACPTSCHHALRRRRSPPCTGRCCPAYERPRAYAAVALP
jgi:hypothetical protein